MSDVPLEYAVRLPGRRQHLVDVTVTVPADLAAGGRLVLPTWTPGSYVVRDYVHHVQRISAADPEGRDVELTPSGHTAWTLPDDVQGPVTVALELYANELTVRTNHVDDHHALLVPAASFPYVEGGEDRRHVVRFELADGDGDVHALLPRDPDAGDAPVFVAEDLDHLVDGAFEVGDFPTVEYEVAGVPHRFVWTGHGGFPDLDRVAADATAIGEVAVELFAGDLPIEEYTFLCIGWDTGAGGLEHRDGAVLQMPVRTFEKPDEYARFQSLVAHEYLHLWNVKRLVPAGLTRFDYERPTHTTSLWVAEGWTAYYDELLPLRAGVWGTRRYLDALGGVAVSVLDTPGAAVQSVQRSSYEAWTKHYIRDENSLNAGVSYYGHGAVLAWCLDLLIRREDPYGHGLDGAFRLLWERFGQGARSSATLLDRSGTGYTEDDVVAAVSEVAGRDLTDFFERHVAGTQLPPVEDLAEAVGLTFAEKSVDVAPAPRLGVVSSETDEGVTFDTVLRGQAAWHAGLTGGDRLLAIDGLKVGRGELTPALRPYRAGDTVEVTVFRGPRLLTLPVTLDEPRPERQLAMVPNPTLEQREAFRSWTGRPLSEVGPT
ncbi:MAG: PDZ domain-containing protein [Actinobacteria bacterium]|nr:PDZ domain-containing protein [Actinomycetota bacterium]